MCITEPISVESHRYNKFFYIYVWCDSVGLAILDTQIKYKKFSFIGVYGINNRLPLFMYLQI